MTKWWFMSGFILLLLSSSLFPSHIFFLLPLHIWFLTLGSFYYLQELCKTCFFNWSKFNASKKPLSLLFLQRFANFYCILKIPVLIFLLFLGIALHTSTVNVFQIIRVKQTLPHSCFFFSLLPSLQRQWKPSNSLPS